MKTIKFHYKLGTNVTLKEMYSIFWKNREYDFFRNLNQMEKPQSFEGYEMTYDLPWETQNSPLLYRHIVAEQLYAKGEKWAYGFPRDYFHVGLLLKLAKLWMNPLVWDYDYFYQKIVVEGRVAKEKYTPEREKSVRQMISAQQEQYILDFADESPICKEDDPQHGSIKGLHYWTVLTWNLDPLFEKVLDGNDYSEEEITQAKSYDAAYLRKNLSIVAAYRSGKRAAELLRNFREEWKQIKIWQLESSNMSEKDMQQFEITLFHGFDDLLEEWEGQGESEEKTATGAGKPDSSFFGTTYSSDVCEKELIKIINHSKNKAAACREILRSETIGYFVLSNKTDQEKADAINPWVAFTNKKYVFTGDDFRKARNS